MKRAIKDLVSGWGVAETTPETEGLLCELRTSERQLLGRLRGLGTREASAFLWCLVAKGVPEACNWDSSATLDELCLRACALRGGLEGGPERLVMRERARVAMHATSLPPAPLRDPADLLALWDEATFAEPVISHRIDQPRWRTREDGLPFTGMAAAWLRGPRPLEPGRQTADPEDIPALVAELIDFIATSSLAPEVAAAHVPHIVFYIHPFVDGNGHTGRMLMCDLLARAGVSAPTLVSYVGVVRARAQECSKLMPTCLLGEATAEDLVRFQLRALAEAQTRATHLLDSYA